MAFTTMRRRLIALALAALLSAAALCTLDACAGGGETYRTITSDEAAKMLQEESIKFIVDVRTPEEYEAGHIPGAINIPVESIGDEPPSMLPATDELVMVYCRTGKRSAQAAQQLVDLGYTNVVDFGGIESWTGEVVTD